MFQFPTNLEEANQAVEALEAKLTLSNEERRYLGVCRWVASQYRVGLPPAKVARGAAKLFPFIQDRQDTTE